LQSKKKNETRGHKAICIRKKKKSAWKIITTAKNRFPTNTMNDGRTTPNKEENTTNELQNKKIDTRVHKTIFFGKKEYTVISFTSKKITRNSDREKSFPHQDCE